MKLERKPNLKAIAMQVFASAPDGPDSLPQLISSQAPARELEIAQDLSLDDLATLIYTSGTSGQPKGVELTHRQVISSVSEVFDRLDVTESDRTLTFLPLSHILARQELWGHYYKGYCMGYGRSVEYLKKDLPLVQPTVLVAVPRIFEKIYLGIHSQVEISKLKHWLFHKALKAGEDVQESYQRGQSASLWSTLKKQAAHQAVLKRVQERLGGRLRFAVSGGAPLDTNIAQFFKNCGLPILEGYGLTETTGAIFVNTLFEHKVGAVGKTIGEVQIKLDEDGEILIKSDKVMRAYHKDPKGTQNAFTDDGYFRTGDIGHQDEDGYLFITDRKKDLIKTANGKFVAPQKLQNRFSREPLISQVHIHGDKRKYIVALLTLDINSAQDLFSDDVPAPEGSSLSQSPRVVKAVRQAVARVNSELASHETIKNYHILDREFSIEEGEITPSLKMRRKAIDQKYADTIQALYKDPLI